MRKIIIFFVIIFISNIVNGQSYPEFRAWNGNGYNVPLNFPANGIASDYGPRNIDDNWHGGIDYNSAMNDGNNDYGDLILATFGGTVVDINRLNRTNGSAAYLVTDAGNFRNAYVHMFYDSNSYLKTMNNGTVVLTCLDGYSGQNCKWAMIFFVDNDTLTKGQIPGTVTYNGNTYNVSDQINQGDIIGPIGESGTNGAHLHLNTIPNNYLTIDDNWNGNPLQYFDYVETTYDYTLFSQNNNSSIELKYPGTDFSPLALKNKISGENNNSTRYDAVMDINQVEFRLKNIAMDTFEIIRGDTKEGKICLGGKLNEAVINHPVGSFGDWTTTGVDAFAYSSHPWDIWHYSDFVSRIHKNDILAIGSHLYSNCPENSRYNDGEYFFKCKTIDIRDNEENTDSQSVVIDNFKPYIKSVNVRTIQSNTLFYNESWTCSNNQCVSFTNNNLSTTLPAGECMSGFLVTVTCSEEMENLVLSIPAYNISNKAPASVSEGSIFTFRIEANEINDLTKEVILHFSGTDKNNNQVISFSPNYAQQCVSIPTRISNTAWTDPNTPDLTYGDDDIHRFKFSCAPQGGLPPGISSNEGTEVIIEGYEILLNGTLTLPTNSGNCKDGAIDLKIAGGISPYEVTWYKVNDNGQNEEIKNAVSQSGNDGSEDLSDLEPGRYLVEVKDALCGIVSQEYELTNCACIAVNKVYQKNVSKCGNNLNSGAPYESCDGELKIEVIGTDQYKVEWSNGYTELEINYLCVGTYIVTVTIEGCDPIINTYEICCCNNETAVDEPYPMCDMPSQINITGADIITPSSSTATDGAIDIHVERGSGATYNWIGPNGFTANTEDISGLTIGTYCVTITNECGGNTGNCYTLVDCSGVNINIQGTVENACDGYNIGKISLTVSGGNAPYKYKWSNGAVSKNLENLSPGSYCVTVTDFNGCKSIKCYTVVGEKIYRNGGGGDDSGKSCYYNLYCRDQLIGTEEVSLTNTSMPPPNCNVGVLLCEPTHQVIAWGWEVPLRNVELFYEKDGCSLEGYCYYYDYKVIKKGSIDIKYVKIKIPPGDGCGECYACYEYTYCKIEDDAIFLLNVKKVDPIVYCDLLSPQFSQNDSLFNINLLEFYYFIKKDSLISSKTQLLLPEGINEFTSLNDYFEFIKNVNLFRVTLLDSKKEIKDISEISCEKLCGNYESQLIVRASDSLFEQKISISPNPFNEKININYIFDYRNEVEIVIFNILGKKVFDGLIEGNITTLDLNSLSDGTYLIKFIHCGNIIKTEKIIKQ